MKFARIGKPFKKKIIIINEGPLFSVFPYSHNLPWAFFLEDGKTSY